MLKYENMIAKHGQSGSLSLKIHSVDAENVSKKLVSNFISKSFCESCGINYGELKKIASFSAYIHDIGKATVCFQYRVTGDHEELRKSIFDGLDSIPAQPPTGSFLHAGIGETILRYLGCPACVASIIGAHHGVPSQNSFLDDRDLNQPWIDIVDNYEIFGSKENKEQFVDLWKTILKEALSNSGYASVSELPTDLPKTAQILLSGLLVMADWIASNTDYFPLDTPFEITNKYINDRTERGWNKLAFPQSWNAVHSVYENDEFQNVFGFLPNDIQKEILSIVNKSDSPALYILEAPMGIGKTEAALSASEVLASKFRKNGLFFGLPTQATANGIFPRIEQWGISQSSDKLHTIQLRHSGADLNEDFQRIKSRIPDDFSDDSGLQIHSWFCNSKKACLADFVVGTVDQLLMMALKRKHVMLLHLGLSEKVVVIDECHAYDAYMNQYLYRALQWLGAYRVPVILLSATLPAKKRIELIEAYSHKKCQNDNIRKNTSYPLLTWTDGDFHQKKLSYDGPHRTVNIVRRSGDEYLPIAQKVLDEGGCVGIIVNTVKRAQAVVGKFSDKETLLYHAQYLQSDRNEKERQLLGRVGKSSTPEDRKGLCVVGTQVLEQSLDIDFDLLITDIAPMDLLLQRIGRLHRHKRSYRPDSAKEACCIILTEEATNEKSSSKTIYGEWLLNVTLKNLPSTSTIAIPDDISSLVQKVYNEEDSEDESYSNYLNVQEILRQNAKAFLLDDVTGNDIHNLLDRDIADTDACAAVRYGESSLEVLAFMKINGSFHYLDGTPLPSDPCESDFIRFATQRIRLPFVFSVGDNAGKVIKALNVDGNDYFGRSFHTKDMPILFFNENREAQLLDFDLKYSYEFGLMYTKGSDSNGK